MAQGADLLEVHVVLDRSQTGPDASSSLTPAEIRMLATMGADLVGMSTVLECIAARHARLEVLGLSLVTNLAAGLAPAPLDHNEVLASGADAGDRLGGLLAELVRRL